VPVVAEHAAHHRFSYDEYLARERDTGLRHEFLDGQVFAMTGGTPEHARLIAEVCFALRSAVDPRRCRVFSSDLRIRIPSTGLATYPDVAVVCGKVEVDGEDPNAVVNPTVLVEVLSPSTEAYDRGEKWAHYRRIEPLRAYVLVSPLAGRLEAFIRTDAGFMNVSASPGETLELRCLGARLATSEIFAQAL
jgi:Uma2 family endonuclease